jgi:hypothetical protein
MCAARWFSARSVASSQRSPARELHDRPAVAGADQALEHRLVALTMPQPLLDRLEVAAQRRLARRAAEAEGAVDRRHARQAQQIADPQEQARAQVPALAAQQAHRLADGAVVVVVEQDLTLLADGIPGARLHQHERGERDLEVAVLLGERPRRPAGREVVVQLPHLGDLAVQPDRDLDEEAGRAVLGRHPARVLDAAVLAQGAHAMLHRLAAGLAQAHHDAVADRRRVPAHPGGRARVGEDHAGPVVHHVIGVGEQRLDEALRRAEGLDAARRIAAGSPRQELQSWWHPLPAGPFVVSSLGSRRANG